MKSDYPALQFILSPTMLPLLGILFCISMGFFKLYQQIIYSQKLFINRLRESIFILLYMLMNIGGYLIWMQKQLIMTPLAASFFISAALVEVIKESLAWRDDRKHYQGHGTQQISQATLTYRYKKHQRIAHINFSVALLMLFIMIAWCTIPASKLLTGSALVGLSLLYLAKHLSIRWTELNYE